MVIDLGKIVDPLISISGILISALAGGFFAGLFSNFFESKRRINELRRDKFFEHRNAMVQIEHELLLVRINLSRNLNSLNTALEVINENNIRVILRLYRINLSPGLSLKLLNIDLINEYCKLFEVLEKINLDIDYLNELTSKIQNEYNQGKVNFGLVDIYLLLIKYLYKSCQQADDLSLNLVSKSRLFFKEKDEILIKKYIKNGGEVIFNISKKDIKKENKKTINQETKPYKNEEEREQFVAPYMDLKRVAI